MARSAKRFLIAVPVLAAILLAGSQVAAAEGAAYSGRISQPPLAPSAGGLSHIAPPTIEFKVIESFGHTTVWPLKVWSIYFHCTDGDVRYPADAGSFKPKLTFEDSIRVKNGKFSAVNNDGLDRIFRVRGKLPTRGHASGTIRISEHVPAYSDPAEGHPAYDCDTGVLNWTAHG